MATLFVHWVEFFPLMKLQNGYTDLKMSPEPEVVSMKWVFVVNYYFKRSFKGGVEGRVVAVPYLSTRSPQ